MSMQQFITFISQCIDFIRDPANDYPMKTVEYFKLCGAAIAAAIVIGVLLGALVSRSAVLAFIATNVSGLVRAVPIIAILLLFVELIPPPNNIGFTPAIIALILLGIPPILLNTYTGIRGIDPATIEAAKGMGMTTWQIATRIQAPLVTPLVAAGIRTSAVQVVATATLAAFIGAGGYGDYIVEGVNILNYPELVVGAISVAILAILVEVFMSWLQRVLTPAGLKVQQQAEQEARVSVAGV
jgi:osmoprotectant transport system permease protein